MAMPAGLKYLLASACCLVLANIYYAQPVIADIAAGIGLEASAGGLIVTMAQIGYCIGVLFLVPLGDLLENRRLIAVLVFCAAGALVAVGASAGITLFFGSMFFVGLFSAVVQIIIPLGVGLAAPHERGRIVGLIMAGAILGIVLARPAASWMTGLFGWRFMYFLSAGLIAVVGLLLLRGLPVRKPAAGRVSYPAIFRSMAKLLVSLPGLRPRLFLMAFSFTGFTFFWAAAPIVLREALHFSHSDIALFSLASFAAPPCALLAGRLVDRGFGFGLTLATACMIAAAFLVTPVFGICAGLFLIAVLLLDPGVNMTNVIVQQSVLSLIPEARSRLNALCVSFAFAGGSIGSSLGPWLYSHYGWSTTAYCGASLAAVVFLLSLYLKSGKAPLPGPILR